MITSNKELMAQARAALSGRWGLAIGVYFVYGLIVGVLAGVSGCASVMPVLYVGNLALLLLGGAFALGIATFGLAFARRDESAKFEMIFSGFSNFGKALGLYLLITLFIFLWALLLIIPGIIASLSYSQVFYIMSEDPNVGVMEAIDKSKKMMNGYKWKLFCLGLRFIGWAILGILTCGIGFLWIAPYIQISYVKFYEDVKANYVEVA